VRAIGDNALAPLEHKDSNRVVDVEPEYVSHGFREQSSPGLCVPSDFRTTGRDGLDLAEVSGRTHSVPRGAVGSGRGRTHRPQPDSTRRVRNACAGGPGRDAPTRAESVWNARATTS
jgi:hypothetical protein